MAHNELSIEMKSFIRRVDEMLVYAEDSSLRMLNEEALTRIQAALLRFPDCERLALQYVLLDRGQVEEVLEWETVSLQGLEKALRNLRNNLVHGHGLTVSIEPTLVDMSTDKFIRSAESKDREIHTQKLWIQEIIESLAFLVPRRIREPFLGDLLEEIEEQKSKGASKSKIWFLAISQLTIAFVQRLKIWNFACKWFVQ
ncbi:MAG: hypothetical protein DHS20C16_33710 [Phycisphaerae bacterium]|nr:MAG: hypothetical protein DHS20C16_33710 [Phycisphaerae bacterium]